MKRILTSNIILFLVCLNGYGQTLTGTVTDSLAIPLPDAIVALIRIPSQTIASYTCTDGAGTFRLTLTSADSDFHALQLRIRLFGYRDQTVPLQVGKTIYNFTLHPYPNELPEALVKPTRPGLLGNGDTTSYRVADFARTTDQSIGDVIRRMPGLSMDNDGMIFYNGKAVSAFYLDGDNLLDDKYHIGTTAIPAAMVERLQVIENQQPIQVRAGQTTGQQTGINITLKDDAKKRPVNQLSLAGGLPDHFDASLTDMIFEHRFKSLNQYKANNVGLSYSNDLTEYNNQAFEDNTGFRPPQPIVTLAPIGYPPIDARRYLFNKSGIVNSNNLYHLPQGWQLKAKASFLYDRQTQQYTNTTSVLLNNQIISYNDQLQDLTRSQRANIELSLTKNQPSLYFSDKLQLRSDRDKGSGTVTNNDAFINQALFTRFTGFSNELQEIHRSKGGCLVELFSFNSLTHDPQSLSLQPTTFPSGYGLPDSLARLTQTIRCSSFYTHEYVAMTIPARITQTYKLGAEWQDQHLSSALHGQAMESGSAVIADSGTNNLKWNRHKLYAETRLDYSNPAGKTRFSLRLPLFWMDTGLDNWSGSASRTISRWYFEPEVTIQLNPLTESTLCLQYSLANDPGSITDFYSGYIQRDYRTLQANQFEYGVGRQEVAVNYTLRKTSKLLFLNLNSKYTRYRTNTVPNTTIADSLTTISSAAAPKPISHAIQLAAAASKYLFDLNLTISANYQYKYAQSNNIENGLFLPFDSYAQQLSFRVDTRLRKQIELSYLVLGSRLFGKLITPGPGQVQSAEPTAIAQSLGQKLQLLWLPKSCIEIKSSLEDLYTPSPPIRAVNNFFVDVGLHYHFTRFRTDAELDVTNFANTGTYRLIQLNTNMLSTTTYALRPRELLLKVSLNL